MDNKIKQNNDNKKEITVQLMLPLEVEVKIDADVSVRTLLEITERMDCSRLNAAYSRLSGDREVSPKQLFQLVILGFMAGIYSTQKLEKACRHDIRFMYVLAGKPAPDYNRFWSFCLLFLLLFS